MYNIEKIYKLHNTSKKELIAKLNLMIKLKKIIPECNKHNCYYYGNDVILCPLQIYRKSIRRVEFVILDENGDHTSHCLFKLLPKLDSHDEI
jgi:hypothetical protein